ncbi:unnamed protein product [Clonostachys rosea]|uniref:Uncharacterized protein n=1 Tax=Bionectria ochroleuca TaxID=29856 RepID=A0ABY6U5D1_BIOOC|nr:unnamed protein product [Clonostachys rosea]
MSSSSSDEDEYPVKPGKYPETWKPIDKDDDNWRNEYFKHMVRMQKDYSNRGILQAPMVQTQSWLLSIQVPSPSHKAIDAKKKIVYLQKKEEGNALSQKKIDLASLNEYKADGWALWQHPSRPTKIPTDRDVRNIPMLKESNSLPMPLFRTALLFPKGIQISTMCDGLNWHAGQLLGTNPSAKAPISTALEFMPPSESGENLASATSRGHVHTYERPKFVGAGWGDYDLYFEWQLHGRVVDRNTVAQKIWKGTDGDFVTFVPAAASSEGGEEIRMASYGPKFKAPKPLRTV